MKGNKVPFKFRAEEVIHVNEYVLDVKHLDRDPRQKTRNGAPNIWRRSVSKYESSHNMKLAIHKDGLLQLPYRMSGQVEKGRGYVRLVQDEALARTSAVPIVKRLSEVLHVVVSDVAAILRNGVIKTRGGMVGDDTGFVVLPDHKHRRGLHTGKELGYRL